MSVTRFVTPSLCHSTGLEDLQLAYELEHLKSLNVSACDAITPDALLVRMSEHSGTDGDRWTPLLTLGAGHGCKRRHACLSDGRSPLLAFSQTLMAEFYWPCSCLDRIQHSRAR